MSAVEAALAGYRRARVTHPAIPAEVWFQMYVGDVAHDVESGYVELPALLAVVQSLTAERKREDADLLVELRTSIARRKFERLAELDPTVVTSVDQVEA